MVNEKNDKVFFFTTDGTEDKLLLACRRFIASLFFQVFFLLKFVMIIQYEIITDCLAPI